MSTVADLNFERTARRRVASLALGPDRLLGLRLARVRGSAPLAEPAGPAALWSAAQQSGVSLLVRWLVFPRSVVGAPGHVEIFVLARAKADLEPAALVAELQALLATAYPQHRFAPIGSIEELQFAVLPFARSRWSLVLGGPTDLRPSRTCGFASPTAGSGDQRSAPEVLSPLADPVRALSLLATARGASVLDWRLEPATRFRPELATRLSAASRVPAEFARPLAFDCCVRWTGAAGSPPSLLKVALAEALGVKDGAFRQSASEDGASCRPAFDLLGDAGSVVASGEVLLSAIPPAPPLIALAPTLSHPVENRLPRVALPTEGATLGRTPDGRTVRLSLNDRRQHCWVVGATGTGKSTYLLNRLLQDLEEGHGVAVFDPHGELVSAIRQHLPASRRDDVVLVDLADRSSPLPALNLLECSDLDTAHVRVGQVLELITSLWPRDFCGPIFQQASTAALLTLAARFEAPGTLADLSRLFLDEKYRSTWIKDESIIERVPEAVAWWTNLFDKMPSYSAADNTGYYISKFSHFFTDLRLREVLGKPRSTIDFRQLMDRRGVLLCSMGRAGANPMATSLLTAVLMQAAFNAALSRADQPERSRVPFFVYCDEFHRVAGPSTGSMLSEVRKYGLGLVMAHQFIDQLSQETLASVLGNVGSRIVFRVGAQDAKCLASHDPSLTVRELTRLPNYTAMVEFMVNGVPSGPFTMLTPPPPGHGQQSS